MLVSFISFVVSLTTCYGWDQHYGYDTGTSEYIHSNDTMVLSLYENTILKVSSGSRHDLEFVFQNRASPSHFTFMYVSTHHLLNNNYFNNKFRVNCKTRRYIWVIMIILILPIYWQWTCAFLLYFFTCSGSSEDGLGGRVQTTEGFLQQDDSTTIRVTGLVIPQRPHDSTVTYTLTVTRDSPIGPVKRSAQGEHKKISMNSL